MFFGDITKAFNIIYPSWIQKMKKKKFFVKHNKVHTLKTSNNNKLKKNHQLVIVWSLSTVFANTLVFHSPES